MKPSAFKYMKAVDLEGTLQCLQQVDSNVKLLGGGQSLLPMMNLRLAWVEQLLDISDLEILKQRKLQEDYYFVGSGVTHATLEDERSDDPTQGYLPTVASGIAYRAIRNKGTIGGSVVHADPAGDWPNALLALDTHVHVHGKRGQRRMPLEEFQVGLMETALAEDEVVIGFELPVLSAGAKWSYQKFNRKSGEFGHAICAAVLDAEQSWGCVVLGALTDKPRRLAASSDWLLKASVTERQSIDAQTEMIQGDLRKVLDYPMGSYEFHLAETLIKRALQEISKS